MAVDEPRDHRAADGVDPDIGRVGGLPADDLLALDQQRARIQALLAGAVMAEVGLSVLRRTQQLLRAVDRDRAHPGSGSSIGILSPESWANSTACS